MALADKAAAAAPAGDTFTKPDISKAIPPDMQDIVARVVAAGMKLMYSTNMRADLQKAIQSPDPTPKVLSDNVVGLMLTMDQKAGKGGIPQGAILPAAIELLGEGATIMVQAGRNVTEDDFKAAMQMTFVLISKKMGMNDAQIMDLANKALPPDQQVAGGAPPDGPAADAAAAQPPDAATPPGMPPGAAAAPAGATPPPDDQEQQQ